MDEATASALVTTATRFYDMAARGDSASLRQNAIASLASDFSGIENAVKENQANLDRSPTGGTSAIPAESRGDGAARTRRIPVRRIRGPRTDSRQRGFRHSQSAARQLRHRHSRRGFSAGRLYGVFRFATAGNDWKLGGFYAKPAQIAGHDGNWFADRAREFKSKGQLRNAWFYFGEARELLVPVPFMATATTDKLYDEMQAVKPADLPPLDLTAGGKTFKVTDLFPVPVGRDFDLVVKYQSADVSDTGKTFQDNLAVMKALLAKYPEFRDAFAGIVVRAVDPSGKDYGSMMPMKDIK